MKSITVILCGLLFLARGVVAGEVSSLSTAEPSVSRRVVYYFHRTVRCPSCLNMERWASEVVGGLCAGSEECPFVLEVINLDEPANAHYEADYQLEYTSIVVSDQVDRQQVRWKNLEGIWTHAHDEEDFKQYLESELLR